MNKFYNISLVAVLCLGASGLGASEEQKKSFFNASTMKALEKSVSFYAYMYGVASVLSCFNAMTAMDVARSSLMSVRSDIINEKALSNYLMKNDGNLFSRLTSEHLIADASRKTADMFLKTSMRQTVRSIPITAPLYFGAVVACNKYQEQQQAANDKERINLNIVNIDKS